MKQNEMYEALEYFVTENLVGELMGLMQTEKFKKEMQDPEFDPSHTFADALADAGYVVFKQAEGFLQWRSEGRKAK